MYRWWILCLIGLMPSFAEAQEKTAKPLYLKPADKFILEVLYYCQTELNPRSVARTIGSRMATGTEVDVDSVCKPVVGYALTEWVRGRDLFRDPKEGTLVATFQRHQDDQFWFVGNVLEMSITPQTRKALVQLEKRQNLAAR